MELASVKILAFLLVLVGPLASFGCNFERCQDEHSWDNLDHFSEFGMVPNLIPCQPKHTATIYYNSNDYVLVGNFLTKKQVKNQPTINYPAFLRRTNYTVMMFDLDAPSSPDDPRLSPYLHFLAVNSYEFVLGTSDIVVPYQSPIPTPGSGNHRYVWFIFKQSGRINPSNLASLRSNRANFSIRQFISGNNLTVPTAGNFFLSRA